jgi:hypothetical protein
MSLQQFKAKLLSVGLFTVSACGTFALFGCVPVIARIASNPPFSIDQIEAFLLQQTDNVLPQEPVGAVITPVYQSSDRSDFSIPEEMNSSHHRSEISTAQHR